MPTLNFNDAQSLNSGYSLDPFTYQYTTQKISINNSSLNSSVTLFNGHVLTQFMIHSIVISFLGGLIGILLRVVVSQIVATFGGYPVVITASLVLLSFLFSSEIGLFFAW